MSQTALEGHLNRQMEHSQGFFWNRLRWELVVQYMPRDVPATLVDVGAGPGFLGDYLRTQRPNVSYRFVEPIAGLEESLEQRFGAEANLREADAYEGVTIATLLDVLEHQEDDRAFLRDLAAKLEPGAVVLLTVPAMPSLWSQWDVLLGHYKRYTRRSFASACEGLPLRIEEAGYLFPELLPVGYVRRLKAGREGSAEAEGSAEFPDLPSWLNATLYRIGRGTQPLRRRLPAGTSLFAVLRRVP